MFIAGIVPPASLDAKMRRSLASSLAHIYEVAGHQLGVPNVVVSEALGHIETHRVEPGIFGRYFKLVPAIQRGDVLEAGALFRDIVDIATHQPEFSVAPLTDAALGPEKPLYCELIAAGGNAVDWLVAPAIDHWSGFDCKVDEALGIIAAVDASLAREVRGLVVRIVGASSANGHYFGGASSFMLWGLLVLNVEAYRDVSLLAEGLVHEAAHQLLFAYSADEPLVSNPLADRFASPLRKDGRPMDGVFHATFVTARMHHLYRRLRDTLSDDRHPVPADLIEAKLLRYRELYYDGLSTIERYGMLTGTGQLVLAETNAYMKAA